MEATQSVKLETYEPVGDRILVRKDDDKKVTKGGILLPSSAEITTLTARVVAISKKVADSPCTIRQYDKVVVDPSRAIPVDFEPDNQLYVVPVEDVIAIIRMDRS